MMETNAAPKIKLAVALLDAMAAAGDAGMSFTECQRFVFERSPVRAGRSFDEPCKWRKNSRHYRGWWCTELCGGYYYGFGLLAVFAVKGADGRYRRNEVAHKGHPFAVLSEARKAR